MNKKLTSIIFLLLAIIISLALGSYNFLVSRSEAKLPFFMEGMKTTKHDINTKPSTTHHRNTKPSTTHHRNTKPSATQ